MGVLSSLFKSAPSYDMGAARDNFLWQQNQARYGVNNGLAGLSWDPNTNTQNITYGGQMRGLIDSLFSGDAAAKRAEQSIYDSFNDKYEKTFDRQNSALQDRLVNQGIPVGSEAYTRAMEDLNQTQNQARQQAYNQAVLTGQQTAAQNKAQNLSIFSAFNPLNGYQPGAGTPNTDLYGQSVGQANNAFAANQNTANNLLSMGANALSALGGGLALLSDARIKENLRPVGMLFNGLTVYAFNFPGDEKTRIGLVAQEVQKLIPEAVTQTEEGLLAVDYGLASMFEEDGREAQSLPEQSALD